MAPATQKTPSLIWGYILIAYVTPLQLYRRSNKLYLITSIPQKSIQKYKTKNKIQKHKTKHKTQKYKTKNKVQKYKTQKTTKNSLHYLTLMITNWQIVIQQTRNLLTLLSCHYQWIIKIYHYHLSPVRLTEKSIIS